MILPSNRNMDKAVCVLHIPRRLTPICLERGIYITDLRGNDDSTSNRRAGIAADLL